ncbi:MAG: glutamyl-tRNA reductase [Gemmatimonadaceae bacterium]
MSSIVVVGCNHSSAPLPVLERVSIPAGELRDALTRLKESVREGLILSTCNRTELYAVTGHAGSGGERLLGILADRGGTPVDDLRSNCYVHTDDAAVRHLLRVAGGLDSMVLGEDQIQAQLKRAITAARMAEALGPMLERLAAAALACGKRVRTFTELGRHAVSLESLAIHAVVTRVGSLVGRNVVVLGSGESARLIMHQLRASEARLTVLSRRPERAEALARHADAASGGLDALPATLARAEVVFCCTSASHPVLTAELPTPRGLVCVDLGMPRDVDPAVANANGVTVIGLPELTQMADAHREERRQHLPAAEAIVETETARFLDWRRARGSAAAIGRLRARAQAVADAETTRALARLESASPHDRALMAELANRVVAKLMHEPTLALKGHPEADNIALALEFAFGLAGAADTLDRAIPQTPGAPDAPSSIEEAAS